jgi:hypothetical protein
MKRQPVGPKTEEDLELKQEQTLAALPRSGLPDFSWHKIPKWTKYTKLQLNYQMATLCSKCPLNIPTFPFQGPPMFTQIRIFGLKIYHLATLDEMLNLSTLCEMLQPAARKVAGSSTARNKDLVAKILQY